MIKFMKDHPLFANKIAVAGAAAKRENAFFSVENQRTNAMRTLICLPPLEFNLKAALKRKLREFGGNNKYVPH